MSNNLIEIIAYKKLSYVPNREIIDVFLNDEGHLKPLGYIVLDNKVVVDLRLFEMITKAASRETNSNFVSFNEIGIYQLLESLNIGLMFDVKNVVIDLRYQDMIVVAGHNTLPIIINDILSTLNKYKKENDTSGICLECVGRENVFQQLTTTSEIYISSMVNINGELVEHFPHKEVFLQHIQTNQHITKRLSIDNPQIQFLRNFTMEQLHNRDIVINPFY